jgi:AcrR family transcriptional regulator
MVDVKPRPSRHRLTLRAERAEVTRRRIAAAARRLFARDGYGATTLRAVAVEAGVAVQTVYAVYGSKAGILRALRDLAMDQPEAAAAFARAMEQTTPADCLGWFARSIRLRWELAGDIVTILGDAATADGAVRAEIDVALRARRRGIAAFGAALGDRFGLVIDPARATAIVLALSLPEIHAELVAVNGWTEDTYEAWLAAALRRELLGAPRDAAEIRP